MHSTCLFTFSSQAADDFQKIKKAIPNMKAQLRHVPAAYLVTPALKTVPVEEWSSVPQNLSILIFEQVRKAQGGELSTQSVLEEVRLIAQDAQIWCSYSRFSGVVFEWKL